MGEDQEPKAQRESTHADIELRLKEAELAIKQAELKSKLGERPGRISASSPLAITLITGMLGLIGAGVANVIQTRSNLQLERQKFESSLILKAIDTGDPEAATKNLLFLLGANLISDPSGNIARLKENPKSAPVLSTSGVPVRLTASAREVFFKRYRAEIGELTPDNESVLTRLFSFIEQDPGIDDVRLLAYILATIKWETANRWQPITEFGSDISFEERYGPNTSWGRALDNTEVGDGARYRGRGYIQLTGKRSYQRMSELLGLTGTENDLVKYPDKALDPLIAYRVTSESMRNGSLTGKKLSQFINGDKADYENARQVVNGHDHAESIAAVARKFEAILRESLSRAN